MCDGRVKNKVRAIGFDVNGTIFDDTNIFFNVINAIFEKFGHNPLPTDVLKEKFGQPWTRIFREAGISESVASDNELYQTYNELYRSQPAAEPFTDLKPLLEWLRDKGIKMAIVSTQQNEITIPMLERHNLREFFDLVEGGVSDKSLAIKNLAAKLGIAPSEFAYIGDQEGDVLHARNANCVSIAFCGGLHTMERLRKAGPDFEIKNHQQISELAIF